MTEERVSRAREFFMQGYNCSQSVTLAFADLYDIEPQLMARISASFGGGIGRMRETCGTACGMFMLAGLEVATPEANPESKKRNYEAVQHLAARFREETGALLCRDLLGLTQKRNDGTIPEIKIVATPEARTDEYYRKRPCVRMVETAVRIYMEWLKEKSDTKTEQQ